MNEFLRDVARLGRGSKRALVIGYDACAMAAAIWLAFSIRIGQFYWPQNEMILMLAAASIVGGIVGLLLLGVYRVVIRYLEVRATSRLALGAAAAAGVWFMLAYLSRIEGLPRSVGFIYFFVLYLLMFFGRLVASQLLAGTPMPGRPGVPVRGLRKRIGVVIQGANDPRVVKAESDLVDVARVRSGAAKATDESVEPRNAALGAARRAADRFLAARARWTSAKLVVQ